MGNPDPTEVAKLLASTLIERLDAKAVQNHHGGYSPVRVDPKDTDSDLIPWHGRDVVDHINGDRTYGHYLVSPEGNCRIFAFDIDLRAKANPDQDEPPIMFDGEEIDPREVWLGPTTPARRDLGRQLAAMTYGLAVMVRKVLQVQVLTSYSGCKGTHVYALMGKHTPASEAREAARMVIDATQGLIVPDKGHNFFKHADQYPALQIEMFPKQDDVGNGGFGNLMRLPLGINRKTGKRGYFITVDRDANMKPDDPLTALKLGSLR